MNEQIKNQIYTLKRNTVNTIDSIQKFRIPALLDFIKLTPIKEYTFEGDYYRIHDMNTHFFIITNHLVGKGDGKQRCYVDSFSNLVKDGFIMPFLLFIEGKAVKWSNMTIVNDYNYTFLIVKGQYTDTSDYKIMNLPNIIKYGEDSSINESADVKLYFNNEGELSSDFPIGIRLEVYDKNVVSGRFILSEDINWFKIKSDRVITNYNILIFKDGLLYPEGIDYIEDMGMNIYKYTNDSDRLDHLLEIYYFYNVNMGENKNVINRFDLTILEDEVMDRLNNGAVNTYLTNLTPKFSFDFNDDNSEDNLSSAKEYIDSYDQLLYRDIYLKNSNSKSIYFTGKQLKSNAVNNLITMSRRDPENDIIMGPMIFKNQFLYEYHYTMEINANNFTFYVSDAIKDDDRFEILYLKNVANPNYELVINDDTIITTEYDIEDIEFYCSEIESSEYDMESNCMIQYSVNFTYERVDTNKYKIILEDDFYYGKLLTMVSKNRYHYCGEEAKYNKMYIELTSDFRFARDIEHYMLFINGQKIPTEYIKILGMKSNQPYDTLALFSNVPIYKGDKVDVFYLPEYVSKFSLSVMEADGIVNTNGKLGFNLDKYLYTFYINGRKIHPDYIQILSKNNIRISKAIGSIRNIEIYQYFKPISELSTDKVDIYNTTMASLTDDKKELLFPHETHIDTEDIYDEGISDKAVNYEVVNAFHRRPDTVIVNPVDNTFTYFVDDIFSEEIVSSDNVDKFGNYIIDLGIAIAEDKAPIYTTDDGSPAYNY